jgi:hypothetical protein
VTFERKLTVVRRGSYLSGEHAAFEVRVVQLELRADEPTSAVFCIQWESPAARGKFNSGLFGFRTIEEASAHVEKSATAVRWAD